MNDDSVLLYSEPSKQRGMYPYHIETVQAFNKKGPAALDWHPIFQGTNTECWEKLYSLPYELTPLDEGYGQQVIEARAAPVPKKQIRRRLFSKAGYVYFLKADNLYKIGKSSRQPSERIAEYSPRLPFATELVKVIESDNCHRLERQLHDRFKSKHVRGEWYALTNDDLGQL